jgi:hypothetical protein
MANIDVVRKRSPSIWLWVIALVILAIVLFAFFGMRGGAAAGNPVSQLIDPALTLTTRAVV